MENLPEPTLPPSMESLEGIPESMAGNIIEDLQPGIKDLAPAKKKKKYVFLKTLAFSALLATSNHEYQRRDKVTEELNPDGEIEYRHLDPETTHLINSLCGYDALTAKERKSIMIDLVLKEAARYQVELDPEKLRTGRLSDESDITSWIEAAYITEAKPDKSKLPEIEKTAENNLRDIDIFREMPKMKKTYRGLWNLEKRTGSPYIGLDLNARVPHYNPLTNRITINGESFPMPGEHILAEAAHATQFSDNPVTSYLKGAEGVALAGLKAITQGKSFSDSYHFSEYDRPGSLEYEAHNYENGIQQKLTDEINALFAEDVKTMNPEDKARIEKKMNAKKQ